MWVPGVLQVSLKDNNLRLYAKDINGRLIREIALPTIRGAGQLLAVRPLQFNGRLIEVGIKIDNVLFGAISFDVIISYANSSENWGRKLVKSGECWTGGPFMIWESTKEATHAQDGT